MSGTSLLDHLLDYFWTNFWLRITTLFTFVHPRTGQPGEIPAANPSQDGIRSDKVAIPSKSGESGAKVARVQESGFFRSNPFLVCIWA